MISMSKLIVAACVAQVSASIAGAGKDSHGKSDIPSCIARPYQWGKTTVKFGQVQSGTCSPDDKDPEASLVAISDTDLTKGSAGVNAAFCAKRCAGYNAGQTYSCKTEADGQTVAKKANGVYDCTLTGKDAFGKDPRDMCMGFRMTATPKYEAEMKAAGQQIELSPDSTNAQCTYFKFNPAYLDSAAAFMPLLSIDTLIANEQAAGHGPIDMENAFANIANEKSPTNFAIWSAGANCKVNHQSRQSNLMFFNTTYVLEGESLCKA